MDGLNGPEETSGALYRFSALALLEPKALRGVVDLRPSIDPAGNPC
ncbi:hypothetical protein [Dinoroseobacter sp. S124A]